MDALPWPSKVAVVAGVRDTYLLPRQVLEEMTQTADETAEPAVQWARSGSCSLAQRPISPGAARPREPAFTAVNTMSSSATIQHDLTVEHAAEALLREHPDALVCALSSNGLIVPVPGSVPLLGQAAIEGRAVIDGVVAADRAEVISLWTRLEAELAVNGKVRMLDKPSRWVTL